MRRAQIRFIRDHYAGVDFSANSGELASAYFRLKIFQRDMKGAGYDA